MNPKEELEQYSFKADRVQEALGEYNKFKERAEKITAIISENPIHSNKISDKVGDNASIMADLDREYQTRWVEAERERLRILDKINKIEEPYRTVLVMRYIHGKTFEQIGTEIGYNYYWVIHAHGDALKMFEKLSNFEQDKATFDVLI